MCLEFEEAVVSSMLTFVVMDESGKRERAAGHFAGFQRELECLGATEYLHEVLDDAPAGTVGHFGLVAFRCKVSARQLRRRWKHGAAEVASCPAAWADQIASWRP